MPPPSALNADRRSITPGYLAAITVLFLPFGRLLLAPLALHWNRHR